MRLRSLALLSVTPLLAPAVAEAQVRDSVITVSTSRTSRVVPDRASVYVIVEGVAETPADAVARDDVKIKAVTEALKGIGGSIVVDRPIPYTVGPTQTNNGYPVQPGPPTNVARAAIRVQVTRLEDLARVAATALGAGAANASSPTFESSAADSVRRSRIADALAAAKADAQAIATSLDGHVGSLVDISTNAGTSFTPQTNLYFDNRFVQNAMAPEIVITTSVTVRYRLVR